MSLISMRLLRRPLWTPRNDNMDLKINFLGDTPDPSRRKFFFFLKFFGVLIAATGIFAALATSNNISEDSAFAQIPIVKRIRQLVHSADRTLEGERDDRINILLLGMGGAGHDGPFLTDTIMLASIKPSTKQIALLSIPRDLAVPIPGFGWYKVNSANAYGEKAEAGSGGELASKAIASQFDMPIHYYLRLDFKGFVKLINDLGGIDVYVDRSFVDSTYPTDVDGEVTEISFDKGWQHMGGDVALKFARSRHGGNSEGSDFARAARQQKILQAVKSKVFSLGTLRSPTKITAVFDALKDNVRTNLTPWEMLAAARLASTLDTENIITEVLDDSPDGMLAPVIGTDGAYLLAPKKNWDEIRKFASDIFIQGATAEIPPAPPLKVEVQNGTFIRGLAAQTAIQLEEKGFEVVKTGNAEARDRDTTIIYDLSDGSRTEELKKLRELLNADVVKYLGAPTAQAEGDVDFLVVLGTDQQ